MSTTVGPHHLHTTPVIFTPAHDAVTKVKTENFFAELDQDFGDFSDHVLLMTFEFSEPWPTWEVHPHGDEVVYLLEGDTDFVLYTAQGEQTVRVCEPGSYVVVPKGIWHTARPHQPTRMLFVTPGQGTLNEPQPPGL